MSGRDAVNMSLYPALSVSKTTRNNNAYREYETIKSFRKKMIFCQFSTTF